MSEFAARAPLHAEGYVGDPRHDSRTTRWESSPTTFGPWGRVSITLAFVAVIPLAFVPMGSAFWPLGLWFLLGYSVLAAIVLRDVWRPVARDPRAGAASAGARLLARHPLLGRRVPVPAPLVFGTALVGSAVVVVVVLAMWRGADDLHRYFAVAGLIALAFGWWLTRWLDE